jgi:hypothetical protein
VPKAGDAAWKKLLNQVARKGFIKAVPAIFDFAKWE